MTDVSVDTTRKAVAKHAYLDANGAVTEDETLATGFRYHHIASGKTFDYQVTEQSKMMLAVFGGKTLATNEASAVRQKAGDMGDQIEAIEERFKLLDSGQWVDRTREGVKIDLDMLAEAVCRVMVESGQATDDQIAAGVKAKVREKLEDKAQVTFVRQVPGVNAAYAALIGKATRSVSDLASLI